MATVRFADLQNLLAAHCDVRMQPCFRHWQIINSIGKTLMDVIGGKQRAHCRSSSDLQQVGVILKFELVTIEVAAASAERSGLSLLLNSRDILFLTLAGELSATICMAFIGYQRLTLTMTLTRMRGHPLQPQIRIFRMRQGSVEAVSMRLSRVRGTEGSRTSQLPQYWSKHAARGS